MPATHPPTWDLVVVGTGFASTFFLAEYLRHAPATARVLVVERGERRSHAWQLENPNALLRAAQDTFVNLTPAKRWGFSVAFGGSSNCWWGLTPRFLPADLRAQSRGGLDADWPLTYEDLEPYYARAEAAMVVAGPEATPLIPRSAPYPQPAHRLTTPDRALAAAWPERFWAAPSARPTAPTERRPLCCGSGNCGLCPVDAKLTVMNELDAPYADPRVTLRTGVEAVAVDHTAGVATALRVRPSAPAGPEETVRAELFALGANAAFNAHLLLRSGLDDDVVGRGLNEQFGLEAVVLLDGMDGLDGGTATTGHGYWFYADVDRTSAAGVLVETWSRPFLRPERGRWRQVMQLKLIADDLRWADNRVTLDPAAPERPVFSHSGPSDYTRAGLQRAVEGLGAVLAPLPVEEVRFAREPTRTENHVLGTAPMGADPATSVVDADLVHHRVRNLLVLGGSAFPTCPPANPTLTLSALSLRAAERLMT